MKYVLCLCVFQPKPQGYPIIRSVEGKRGVKAGLKKIGSEVIRHAHTLKETLDAEDATSVVRALYALVVCVAVVPRCILQVRNVWILFVADTGIVRPAVAAFG